MASPPDRRISDCIGNTPLLRIHLFEDEAPDLLVLGKAEFMNPGGSVKDRPALRMVQEAQRSGQLGRGQVLLDSTKMCIRDRCVWLRVGLSEKPRVGG